METYQDGTPLAPGDSLEDNPQGGTPPDPFEAFVERHGLVMDAEETDSNPYQVGEPASWSRDGSHWRVTIRRREDNRALPEQPACSLVFTQGAAYRHFNKKARQSHPLVQALEGMRVRGGQSYEEARIRPGDPLTFHAVGRLTEKDRQELRRITDPDVPKVARVLECLHADASSLEATDGFEDWADNLGMNGDSRRALAGYLATQAHVRALIRVLGSAWREFLAIEP